MWNHAKLSLGKATLVLLALILGGASLLTPYTAAPAAASVAIATDAGPVLALSHSITDEPLVGGVVTYAIKVTNKGVTPVADKGYNVTISDTLPSGLTYVTANPAPTFVQANSDGTTNLFWDNMVDLEVTEAFELSVTASLSGAVLVGTQFTNRVLAKFNTVPDNSGRWVQATSNLQAQPQPIDMELAVRPSTAEEQATGAGEMTGAPGRGAGADWPYTYEATIRNNAVNSTTNVIAQVILPPGVAYLGNPAFSSNPNNASTAPSLSLAGDGRLTLAWNLGNFTTAQYGTPVRISFAAAIPYRERTGAEGQAAAGPFAGPMSGALILEDTVYGVDYNVTASYLGAPGADGSLATPGDDPARTVVAELLTVDKVASPAVVGVGSEVTFSLNYYVSEYYTVTSGTLADVLPDGMTYIAGSASLAPRAVLTNTPGAGESTIVWDLPAADTGAGKQGAVTFRAVVDAAYEGPGLAGQPLVSGDSLTNDVTIGGDWQDAVNTGRSGSTTPDTASATVATRMPSFTKQVFNPVSSTWGASMDAFVGDTVRFRLTFAGAADVDAKEIVIRDFLPRGMTYVNGSAAHAQAGVFSNSGNCTAAPSSPTLGTLNGLQYLEWRLCNAAAGATWQAEIGALVGPKPNVQPGWIVANFGKMSGQNSFGQSYSLRGMANTNYKAPNLIVTKTASPSSGLVAGSMVQYVVTVANSGPATAYNIVLSDTVGLSMTIPATGGSSTPAGATFTTFAGSPAMAQGGTLRWSTVASLAPGKSVVYRYSGVVAPGMAAGASIRNIASVAYNSRADNTGDQIAFSSDPAAGNAEEKFVYIRGVTLAKTVNKTFATIGETVRYTLTGRVPTGVIAHWPVVEENDLPQGFDYIGTVAVLTATLDTLNHTPNPLDNANRDVRWFLNTLNNTAGSTDLYFAVVFDAMVTGFAAGAPGTRYYTANCCVTSANNQSYVGWYDRTTGYTGDANSANGAWHGYETNRIDRRSPVANRAIDIRQPYITLQKSASRNSVGAGDIISYTVTVANFGNNNAYDIPVQDVIPAGLSYLGDAVVTVNYPAGFPVLPEADMTHVTGSNSAGAGALNFAIDRLYVGATVRIVYSVQVAPTISADTALTNTVTVSSYSTRPGNPGDGNGDGQVDERIYAALNNSAVVRTPSGSVGKSDSGNELTYGATLVYTISVPASPINATMYNVVVTDAVDSKLQVLGVSNGSAAGNLVSASFASIPPNTQQTIVIQALLPANSTAAVGALVTNQGFVVYNFGGRKGSNIVTNAVSMPALVLGKSVDRYEIAQGGVLTYTVTVRNVGNGRAENVQVVDTLPASLSLVAGTFTLNGSASALGGTNWSLPDLAGNSQHVITFQAIATAAEAGVPYTNTVVAIATDSLGSPVPADNSGRIAADTDPDDSASATVFGPLVWSTESTFVAFEDLKQVGWCDWDYNDFVVKMTVRRGMDAAGQLVIAEFTYEAMAHGGAFDHKFLHGLPFLGGGDYRLQLWNGAGVELANTSGTFGEDEPAFEIFAHTKEAMPLLPNSPPDRPFTNTLPEQTTRVDGHVARLAVWLKDPVLNLNAALPPLPWDTHLFVYNTGKEVHLVQPGYLDNTQVVNSIFDSANPMLGFDLPLASVFNTGWRWPQEFLGIWRVYPDYVNSVATSGLVNPQWWDPSLSEVNTEYAWNGGDTVSVVAADMQWGDSVQDRYFGSPLVVDLDGNGTLEFVIGNLVQWQVEVYDAAGNMKSGWPQYTQKEIKASPAAADLDGDGDLEIVVGDTKGMLYAFHHNGTAMAGWPIDADGSADKNFRVLSKPTLVDLDGDARIEVVLAHSDGKLHVFAANGVEKSGFPVGLGNAADAFGSNIINSAATVADVDGDGSLDIVAGSYDHNVYAYRSNGQALWAFNTGDVVVSTPAVADIDPSRPGLETVVGSGDRFVYLIDSAGAQIWKRPTGWTIRSSPLVADVDGNGDKEIIIGSDDNKVWIWSHDGAVLPGWPQSTGADVFAPPVMADVDGDGVAEIVAASDDTRIYAWKANGALVAGWPQEMGSTTKGAPAVANLDGDVEMEVVTANFDGVFGRFNVAGLPLRYFLPLAGK